MLKVEVNKDDMKLLASGNVLEITADVSTVIQELYEKFEKAKAQEIFIDSLKSFLDEGVYKMSDEELEEHIKKNVEEAKTKEEQEQKNLENEIKTMIDLMKKVLEEK